MYNQEIKTKQVAKKVAKQIANDVMEAIGYFDGYDVKVDDDSQYQVEVQVTSSTSCKIITDPVIYYLSQVKHAYATMYKNVESKIDMIERDKEMRPAYVIEVGWR